MVTGLYYPLPIIYGAIGVGWYNVTYYYDQSRYPLLSDMTTQKIGWHLGGGLELPAGSNLKLSVDFRYVSLNYDFQTISDSGNMKSNFSVITIGFLFGL